MQSKCNFFSIIKNAPHNVHAISTCYTYEHLLLPFGEYRCNIAVLHPTFIHCDTPDGSTKRARYTYIL